MRVLRTAADVLVWMLAVLGVVSAGVWAANAAGLVTPLVVVSGSMEPGIMTGDLLIDRPVPVDEVQVGDVLSLPDPVTGTLVTHRVIDVARQDGAWHIRMQGDANDSADGGAYVVTDDTVLSPRWQVGGAGTVLTRLTTPATAVPLLVALVALLAMSQLPRTPSGPAQRRHRPAPGDPTTPAAPRRQEDAVCDPPVAASRSASSV